MQELQAKRNKMAYRKITAAERDHYLSDIKPFNDKMILDKQQRKMEELEKKRLSVLQRQREEAQYEEDLQSKWEDEVAVKQQRHQELLDDIESQRFYREEKKLGLSHVKQQKINTEEEEAAQDLARASQEEWLKNMALIMAPSYRDVRENVLLALGKGQTLMKEKEGTEERLQLKWSEKPCDEELRALKERQQASKKVRHQQKLDDIEEKRHFHEMRRKREEEADLNRRRALEENIRLAQKREIEEAKQRDIRERAKTQRKKEAAEASQREQLKRRIEAENIALKKKQDEFLLKQEAQLRKATAHIREEERKKEEKLRRINGILIENDYRDFKNQYHHPHRKFDVSQWAKPVQMDPELDMMESSKEKPKKPMIDPISEERTRQLRVEFSKPDYVGKNSERLPKLGTNPEIERRQMGGPPPFPTYTVYNNEMKRVPKIVHTNKTKAERTQEMYDRMWAERAQEMVDAREQNTKLAPDPAPTETKNYLSSSWMAEHRDVNGNVLRSFRTPQTSLVRQLHRGLGPLPLLGHSPDPFQCRMPRPPTQPPPDRKLMGETQRLPLQCRRVVLHRR